MNISNLPLVSIIVPIYNVESYISACIISIISQTYRPIEVIFVDDCGIDKSVSLAIDLLKSSNINYKTAKHLANRGLSAARNTGVKYANGDYIYFLDSDDMLPPDSIYSLVKTIQEDDSDLAFGQFEIHKNNSISLSNIAFSFPKGQQLKPDDFFCEKFGAPAWNKLIKKRFYNESALSFPEGYVYEDEIWAYDVTCKEPTIVQTNTVTYYYLIRESSITTHKELPKNNIISSVHILEFATQTAKKNKHISSPAFAKWYEKRCTSAIIKVLSSNLLKVKEKKYILNHIRNDLFFPTKQMKSSNKMIKYALCLSSFGLPFSISCILIHKMHSFLSKLRFSGTASKKSRE